jgi:HD-GYP domain-containing protein (c-di-GMP phosphodiesterase class II)
MGDRRLGVWARLLLPFGLPVMLLSVLRASPGLDPIYHNPHFHLVVVSSIAAWALLVAVAASRAAAYSGTPGPVWLAFGCIGVGAFMLIHGLMTPGVVGIQPNLWVDRAPYLAIAFFAVGLALAGRARNARTSRFATRHATPLLAGTVAVLLALLLALVRNQTSLWGARPFPGEAQARSVLTVLAIGLLLPVAVVHWRRWRLGHDSVQYSLTFAALMAAAAMLSLQIGANGRLSWWDYHVFLFFGFGSAVYTVWLRYQRTHTVESVLACTFEHDELTHLVEGYPDALRSLVKAVEVKDVYTHGHSERTARVAVQLGLRLHVGDDMLRVLARGAYLHDVGKIAIPDAVLNKPGALTDDERALIETHPRIGGELVAPVAQLREVLPAVVHHHERWDASGYPDRLGGRDIPLVARIVAIADVWDAMTSDRSYRRGFTPQVALGHIVSGRGTHFDPRLVDAFLGLAADWGYHPTNVGDSAEAWLAAETCHDALASKA